MCCPDANPGHRDGKPAANHLSYGTAFLQAVLKRNPGFLTVTSVCQVLNGDDVDPPEDIASEKIPLLKYAPMTSCNAERNFSAYKDILSDKR
jgi:hypothetical protein